MIQAFRKMTEITKQSFTLVLNCFAQAEIDP